MKTQRLVRSLALASACASVQLASGEIAVDGPDDTRIVVGQDPNPVFSLQNTGAAKGFDASVVPVLPINFAQGSTAVSGTGSINAVIGADSSGNIVIDTPALSGAAGSTYDVDLTVVPSGGSAIDTGVTYTLVENRPLAGTATFNAGRHMLSHGIGAITLSGGDLTAATGTNVSVNANGYAEVNGFRLTSGSNFTFNGPGQTHALDVRRAAVGNYNLTFSLPSNNGHTQNPGGTITADFGGTTNSAGHRIDPLLSVERIQGANVNLSGVSITASGTALIDRQLAHVPEPKPVARVIQGQASTVDIDTTSQIGSAGSDAHFTRLKLKAFDLTQAGVRAKLDDDATFNGNGPAATVRLTGTLTVDNSSIGAKTNVFNVGSSIESVENLPGESVQSSLPLTVQYNVLANNEVRGRNTIIYAYSGSPSFAGATFTNESLGQKFSTETHTDIGIHNTFVPNAVSGAINLTSSNGGITGEGLAGEQVQESFSYNWSSQFVGRAAVGGTGTGTKLKPGDTFTLRNAVGNHAAAVGSAFVGGAQRDAFRVGPMPGPPFGFGRPLTLLPGEEVNWAISLRPGIPTTSPDAFGRVYQATITHRYFDVYGGTLDNPATSAEHGTIWGGGQQSERSWTIEHVVAAGPSNDSQTTLPTGTDLGDEGLIATSTRQTTAALIDSATLGNAVDVRVQFAAADGAQQAAGVLGDVVSLTGLDGVLHVLQVGFDPGVGTPEALAWFRPGEVEGTGDWVNAVLGNGDITDLDLEAGTLKVDGDDAEIDDYLSSMRYVGAYSAYLLENDLATPELGAWGVDATRNVVWAVIDHNSDFAAVPEPASLGAASLLGGAFLLRRRRRA